MFGFKKKKPEELFRERIAASDKLGAERLVINLFEKSSSQEHELAWFAGAVYECNLDGAYAVIGDFVQRFPNSDHPVRPLLADLYARSLRYGLATYHARIYLRTAKDSGLLETMGTTTIVRDGISRAFLLLTGAYTELGARSYSKSLLKNSQRYALSDKWRPVIESEIERLNQELEDLQNQTADTDWNRFFETGLHADKRYEQCKSLGYEEMMDRVDLLEGNFRFNAEFTVTADTAFLIVHRDGDNKALI